jgi:hypothetical protein
VATGPAPKHHHHHHHEHGVGEPQLAYTR